ncbi:MAG: hypothetical protein ACRCZN_02495 [Lactococcus lactis]
MTVSELIKYLKKCDQDLEVTTSAIIGFDGVIDEPVVEEDIEITNKKVVIYCGG